MSDYEQSYLGQLRKLVGQRKLLVPAVRAIIQDESGCVLLVQRSDNQQWAMPAGSMELDESILDACKREVWEETGLTVEKATLIAIYTEPKYSIVTAHGDPYQGVSFVFRIDAWLGEIVTETNETIDARFFSLDDLPDIGLLYQETLEDLKQFDGTVILK